MGHKHKKKKKFNHMRKLTPAAQSKAKELIAWAQSTHRMDGTTGDGTTGISIESAIAFIEQKKKGGASPAELYACTQAAASILNLRFSQFVKALPTPELGIVCPYCGKPAVYADSAIIYNGKSYGMVWMCSDYPRCDAFVGCHQGTVFPKGSLANRALRDQRKLAHSEFDKIWKEQGKSRTEAYRELAEKLGIEVTKCHIGMFDIDMCKKVITICQTP